MKVSEYIKELNVGMIIKGYNIVESGSAEYIENRTELLNMYCGYFEFQEHILGVRPFLVMEPHKLAIAWETVCLRNQEGVIRSVNLHNLTPIEMRALANLRSELECLTTDADTNIDNVFNELNFVRHAVV